MSGIAGLFYFDLKPIELQEMQGMVTRLARRGPDGAGVWHAGSVGLGHTMLRTTPESLTEKLPLADSTQKVVITADARLDNRSELLHKLGCHSTNNRPYTDSELILRAYQKWEEECVHHLLGDFAFTIWDARKQQLLCARDHFGVRPFYYYHAEGQLFAFASEAQAILGLPAVPCILNEARIADYLVGELERIDKVSTFYQNIFKLPPAHRLLITKQGGKLSQYWSLDPNQVTRCNSDDEYAEAFRGILKEAIHCRLRSSSSAGVLLSGGLDSQTILGLAKPSSSASTALHTFSAVSPDPTDCIETRLIHSALKQFQVNAHLVRWDELKPYLPKLDEVFFKQEDLFDSMMTLPRVLYSEARSQGVPVVLDGLDPDLITTTRGHIPYLLRAGKFMTAWQEAKGLSYFTFNYESASRYYYGGLRQAFIPNWLRQARHSWQQLNKQRRRLEQSLKDSLLDADFGRRIGLAERLQILDNQQPFLRLNTIAENTCNLLNRPILAVGLERYSRAAAAHGIEQRHPFLDKRLAEFCIGLPWDQKIKHGWTKILMRRIMSGVIPEEVRWRRGREHLGWKFTCTWLSHQQDFLRALVLKQMCELQQFVQVEKLKPLCSNKLPLQSDQDFNTLWRAANLASFLSQHGHITRGPDQKLTRWGSGTDVLVSSGQSYSVAN